MSDRTISALLVSALVIAAGIIGYLIGSAASHRRFSVRAALALMFAVAIVAAVVSSVEQP